jgi:pSer/pThr/pTyr-binding forkhead associated (FHA) protein
MESIPFWNSPMTTEIRIKVVNGAMKGSAFIFCKTSACVVGRAPNCTIRVPATDEGLDVSRYHCLFEIDPPYIWVRDLDSTNGTYLNERRIKPSKELLELVRDGDTIRVGTLEMTVTIDTDPTNHSATVPVKASKYDTDPQVDLN